MKNKLDTEKISVTPLNKYIAHAGVCSRRKAVELIEAGLVTINGKIVKEPGYKVGAQDAVKIKNKLISKVQELLYIVLNKPRGYVTTVRDDQGRPTVLDLLVKLPKKQRVYPVGRLDINSTGVLLLTNDGDLAQKMAHPTNRVPKVYDVMVHKEITEGDLIILKNGVRLRDGIVRIEDFHVLPDSKQQKIRVTLQTGKNRVVRRIFEHLGYIVEKLDRVNFGGITKKTLSLGDWRMLNKTEVNRLKKW